MSSLCCASCSKQMWAGADAFPQQGQHRSWPPPSWGPPRLPLMATNIALPSLLWHRQVTVLAPTRTGPAAALLPPVLDTVQQIAVLTPQKSFGGELDRQRLRG